MAISMGRPTVPVIADAERVPARTGGGGRSSLFRGFGKSVKPLEVLFFTSQLSLMLEIGTSLNVALKAIGVQTGNPAFKEVIHSMVEDVEEGRQLSEAMSEHPHVFGGVTTSMIRAGETGGFLKEILDRIVEIQEKRQALITQLRSALAYPVVLCVMAVLVVVFILIYVLPNFTGFFLGRESILPMTTRLLMSMSASLKGYWWAYLTGVGGLVVGFKFAKQSQAGKAFMDWFAVSGPLVARLCNRIYTCQFLRTLGSLMGSQVALLEALQVTRGSIGNRYFRKFIDTIVEHVRDGGRFSTPFTTYPYILDSVKQMVATAEETGNLPTVMLRLAEFYDSEVDRALKKFASMIEPIALIVMGTVVGLIVSSVILPLFKLAHMTQ
jgi:type II secretory pathway component PulF